MDFEQLVMHDVDKKYRDMARGTTDQPLSKTPMVISNSTYEKKRNTYYKRLDSEKIDFNKAIVKIKNAQTTRLRDEEKKREEKERKRANRRVATKKIAKVFLTLVIVVGALSALIGFVIWPKMIYPNLDAESMYTPEILQSYCKSEDGQDEIFTFTDCSNSGQVSATWEIYSDDGSWKINLTGKITEKKNSGDIVIQWTSNEVVYKPNSGSWTDEVSATIKDNFKTLKTDADTFTAGVNDEYTISTADDFKKLANSNKTYHLKNDIDMSGKKWTPIEGFTGILLGNGRTISNLSIETSSSNVGFFATLGGMVKGVNFENANVIVNGRCENIGILCGTLNGNVVDTNVSGVVSASSSNNVGGIAGYVSCSVLSDMKELSNNASITGKNYVGGIFGKLESNTKGDSTTWTLEAFENTGNIKASENYAGGLIGYLYANNSSSPYYGDQNTTVNINDSKNMGLVEGKLYVGGLIGFGYADSNESIIQNCQNSSSITADAIVGCIAGSLQNIKIDYCDNQNSYLKVQKYYIDGESKYAYVGGYVGIGYWISHCINNVVIDYQEDGSYVGGIAGYVSCSVLNDMKELSNNASITGKNYVGGIFGKLESNTKGDSTTWTLEAFENTGNIKASENYAGGLIGYLYANNSSSPYYGDQNTTVYVYSFINKGSIQGKRNVGGLFGYAESDSKASTIIDSSSSGLVNGSSDYGKIAGKLENITIK